jgi:hypothetical protein
MKEPPEPPNHLRVLAEIERSLPVLSWRIDEVPIWPLVRILAGYHLRQPQFQPQQQHVLPQSATGSQALQEACRKQADYLFLSFSGFRPRADCCEDRHLEGLLRYLAERGRSYLFLELLNSSVPTLRGGAHDLTIPPAWIPRRKSPSKAELLECLHTLPDYPAVLLQLGRLPQLPPDPADTLAAQLNQVLSCRTLFRAVLLGCQPKAAFCTCYYAPEGLALMLACQERGVPGVDVQHGVRGLDHPAYAHWQAQPPGGYPLLPRLFWVWQPGDAALIEQWAGPGRTLAAGPGWLLGAAPAKMRHARGKKRILITLQPATPLPPWFPAWFSKARQKYTVLLRPHPRMAELELRQLAQSLSLPVEEIRRMGGDLWPVLAQADLHLTSCSSTVLEAQAAGLPSLALERRAAAMFPAQLASGWLQICLDEVSLDAAIAHSLRSKPPNDASFYHSQPEQILAALPEAVPPEAKDDALAVWLALALPLQWDLQRVPNFLKEPQQRLLRHFAQLPALLLAGEGESQAGELLAWLSTHAGPDDGQPLLPAMARLLKPHPEALARWGERTWQLLYRLLASLPPCESSWLEALLQAPRMRLLALGETNWQCCYLKGRAAKRAMRLPLAHRCLSRAMALLGEGRELQVEWLRSLTYHLAVCRFALGHEARTAFMACHPETHGRARSYLACMTAKKRKSLPRSGKRTVRLAPPRVRLLIPWFRLPR